MFGVFRTVKQFLPLLIVFSWDFNSWSKMPENTVKNALLAKSPGPGLCFTSRSKLSKPMPKYGKVFEQESTEGTEKTCFLFCLP